MNRTKVAWIIVFFVLAFGTTALSNDINAFIRKAKQMNDPWHALAVTASAGFSSDDGLMDRIQREAELRRVAPIDARIDRVWKAIPGYNGLEVDIEQTYRLNQLTPPDQPLHLVYREVAPKVSLNDLGAQPIFRGNPNKPMVSLMINVAWGNEYIQPMLNILKKEQVKATFFLDGSWLKKNVEMAKLIQQDGHEMSNHAYSHPNMSELGRSQATDQIMKTQTLLTKHLGVDNRLFAPPSGDFNDQTVKIAYEYNMKTILWTIDTVDWKKPSPAWIIRKISQRLEPGSLILMHPTSSSSEALSGIIQEVKRRGFVLGTVSQLISPDRVPGDFNLKRTVQ